MNARSLLASLLLALACGCGDGKNPLDTELDLGYSCLSAGQNEEALAHFDSALHRLSPDSEWYLAAKLGQVESLIHIDAQRAGAALLSAPNDHGIGPGDYLHVTSVLGEAAFVTARKGDLDDAYRTMAVAEQILLAGSQRFPGNEIWSRLRA